MSRGRARGGARLRQVSVAAENTINLKVGEPDYGARVTELGLDRGRGTG